MKYIEIEGGHPIRGELAVQGSKNAALPMMAAALLTSQPVVLERCPQIEDVQVMCELLRYVGAEVTWQGERVRIHARRIQNTQLPQKLVNRMRSSVMLMGPLLSRAGEVKMCFPGGCVIGARPIDLHIEGLRKLGYNFQEEKGCISGWQSRSELTGKRKSAFGVRRIHLEYPSVGATENLLMASVLEPGETVLTGAAREPEVQELAFMLRQMGAQIDGIGTERIRINGVARLGGICRWIMADRIVAGTYLIAAALTGGELLLHYVNPLDSFALLQTLEEMGCRIAYNEKQQWIHLRGPKRLKAAEVITKPYPGFPTDLQAMMMVAMSQAEGISHMKETVFENRYRHVEALRRMGARVNVQDNEATLWGSCRLKGNELWATDLRAGAAMVLAGLCAEGVSRIYNLEHVERGYESIVKDLFVLGAHIRERTY